MRIVALIYDDLDNPWLGGGGARRTYEVARRLAARHAVTVVVSGYLGAGHERIRDGVRYLFTAPQAGYAASRLAYMRGAPLLARKLASDLTIEVFSAYNPLFTPLWVKRPHLAILHNIYRDHAAAKHGLIGRLAALLERPALAGFRNYLAVSHGLANELAHTVPLRGKRLAVIPNGIDTAFFTGPQTSGRPDYALFLGRIDIYQKGLDTLLAALHRANNETLTMGWQGVINHAPTASNLVAQFIASSNDDVGAQFIAPSHRESAPIRLLIAGGGPDEQEGRIRDLIAGYGLGDAVEMLGRVSQEQAANLLLDTACRFVVMPSRHESYPLVAAEAGAAGKAVLAFDISGLREAAPASAHGLLLSPPLMSGEGWGEASEEQRVTALSVGLTRLWCDPQRAARLGERGRVWARRYTWDAVAEAEERYYLSLAGVGG
jgi:glycogen synthase